ncbi:DUF3331 domain-containing protein [Paraburkholderia phenazinium]|uniref:DUF3331 domain-containing protein n=1 Tax=Paraburkholderia phenazinium TaxID=60549 RepID=UPI001FC8A6B7|nr:DUF3331 domain-containing protein [Paraburkholderia phenazinium]
MNVTGPEPDFAATMKTPTARNRHLKNNAAQRNDVVERAFVSTGEAQASKVSALAPPRLADPWAVVIAGLKESAAPTQDKASESDLKETRNAGDTQTTSRRPASRPGRDCANQARRGAAADRARAPSVSAESAVVTFVERFSPKSVSITWRDSTAANYCEQLWIRRIARSQGVCALTGSSIVRGDAVYGPAGRTAARPANAAQMVLADAIEELEASA